jgi:cell division septation protein DedD
MSTHLQSDEASGEIAAPRQRQAWRAVLLALAVVGLAGGSWWADHSRSRAPEAGAVPEIHADPAPVKEAPRDPGGMVVPDQDSVLLNRGDGRSDKKPKVEELLPPPEVALPRPAPPPAPAPSTSVAPAPAMTQEPMPAAPVAPTAAAQAPPASAAPLAATTTKPPVVAPAKPTKPAPSAGSGYRLQLGALKSEAAAKQEWQRLQHQAPDVLGHLNLSVSRVDLGERGLYFRIQAGPIAEEGVASQACSILKNRNIGCMLVKP